MKTLYDFQVKKSDGSLLKLSEYKGKTVVIVNTASKCGFTPQYTGLENLYKKYKDKGLVILGFPCNQFLSQEPGSDTEIQKFCSLNYGISFPVMAKIEVNGPGRDPLYDWLCTSTKTFLGKGDIKWNFTKFLLDGEGRIRRRFKPADTPESMEPAVQALLDGRG